MPDFNYFGKSIKDTEENLHHAGAEKCKICGIWQGKEWLTNGICDDCRKDIV